METVVPEGTPDPKLNDPPPPDTPATQKKAPIDIAKDVGAIIGIALGVMGFFISCSDHQRSAVKDAQDVADKLAVQQQTWRSCYLLGKRLEMVELDYTAYPTESYHKGETPSVRLALAVAEIERVANGAHVDIKQALEVAYKRGQPGISHMLAVDQNFDRVSEEIRVNNSTQNPTRARAYFEIGRQIGRLSKAQHRFDDESDSAAVDITVKDAKSQKGKVLISKETLYTYGQWGPLNASDLNATLATAGLKFRVQTPKTDAVFKDGTPAATFVFPSSVMRQHPPVGSGYTPTIENDVIDYEETYPNFHLHNVEMQPDPDGKGLIVLSDPNALLFATKEMPKRASVLAGHKAANDYVQNLISAVQQEAGINEGE